MRLFALPVLVLALILSFWGCKTTSDPSDLENEPQEQQSNANDTEAPVMEDGILGTVRYLEFEGGFYGIVTEEGNYLPLNLDEEFKQDSLRVRFKMNPRRDVVTIAMWGQPVDITEIERVP